MADVYFYDQANNKLMARIQNLSNFDYGCTQVIIDRAGTGTTPFWNNTPANYLMDKTFHVIPAVNNPSGSYKITLYYTQAEINGWMTATGQTLSAIELVKTALPISNVTPATPTGAGAMITGLPLVSTVATSTGLTYNFTTGFSGFGAGFIGTVLPLSEIILQARLQQDHASLSWHTDYFNGVSGFDAERSYDGLTFAKIGYIAADDRSNGDYAFDDPDPAHTANYYRIRELGADGTLKYSKTVMVQGTSSTEFKVLTNPFTDAIDVQWGEPSAGTVHARLLDVTGKELVTNSSGQQGLTKLHIDLRTIVWRREFIYLTSGSMPAITLRES